MRFTKGFLWAFLLLMPLIFLNVNVAFAFEDDEIPEVTAKVARISFIRGNAQIKRNNSKDWEKAVQNLPLVEGDQIATDSNSRLEIQFDTQKYLRLDENSYLKISTLRDEGIAISLPQGTMSVRLLEFDKDRNYFEIDAPQTTVSIQKYGLYRVDSGDRNNSEVRIAVTEEGQAKIYSDNSGFTLRNGRSAKIFLDGNNQGEWETSDASRYVDEFDNWVLDRDAKTSKRLQQAYYDKYYDRDMYGAEELNDYGEWIYTKKYGYVWRPYRSSVSNYRDWSPYRYGHWRYIYPFGWTWVNDESWGWTTYHHGRWIYDDGDWCWTPYTYYRPKRSWWFPALVYVVYSGNNICWYPTGYYDRWYDYNRGHRGRGNGGYGYGGNTTIINNNTIIINPTPTPRITPTPPNNAVGGDVPVRGIDQMPRIPPNSIISLPSDQFGKIKGDIKPVSADEAKKILREEKGIVRGLPKLNNEIASDVKVERDVLAKRPGLRNQPIETVQTGATDRKIGVKSDDTLQTEVVRGGRKPVDRQRDLSGSGGAGVEIRDTGAVERPVQKSDDENNRRQPMPRNNPSDNSGGNSGKSDNSNDRRPIYQPREKSDNNNNGDTNMRQPVSRPREDENKRPSQPIYTPPQREPERKPRETPRNETPRSEPPREKPRSEPQPRNDVPKRSEPPREDRKPSSPPPSEKRSDTEQKDN